METKRKMLEPYTCPHCATVHDNAEVDDAACARCGRCQDCAPSSLLGISDMCDDCQQEKGRW